jgi:uncharacterized membrane protein YhaH (DUF805 family)
MAAQPRATRSGRGRRFDYRVYGVIWTILGVALLLAGFVQGIVAVDDKGVGFSVALAILGLLFFVPGIVFLALGQIFPDSMFAEPP